MVTRLGVVGGVVSHSTASTAGTGEEPGAVIPYQRSHPLAGGREFVQEGYLDDMRGVGG